MEDTLYVGGITEAVGTEKKLLYSNQYTSGHLELGYVYTGTIGAWTAEMLSVVSLHEGKPVELVNLLGEPRGIVPRDGELHVITFLKRIHDDPPGESGEWAVSAFAPDGTARRDILDKAPQVSYGFATLMESAAPDFSSFGFVATTWMTRVWPANRWR